MIAREREISLNYFSIEGVNPVAQSRTKPCRSAGCAIDSAEPLVCRDLSFSRLFFGAVGRQTGVPNFVKKRAIADVQRARRLLAVPMVIVKHLENDLALQRTRGLACELL